MTAEREDYESPLHHGPVYDHGFSNRRRNYPRTPCPKYAACLPDHGIDVTNPEGYQKEFLPAAWPTIKAHGGRTLAAGQPTSISGDPTRSRTSILQFETMEQLQGWMNSPDWQAARAIGLKYAKYRSFAVPGVAQQ